MEDAMRKETQKRTRELHLEVKKETISHVGTTDAGYVWAAMCDFCGRRGHVSEECTKRRKMAEAEVRFKVPAAVLIKPEPT